MKVTYDIIRVDGDVEVTEDVPQSDLDLIAEAESLEWGQIAFRHMEDEGLPPHGGRGSDGVGEEADTLHDGEGLPQGGIQL